MMVKIQVTVLHPTHPKMIGEDFVGIEMDFISSLESFYLGNLHLKQFQFH